MRTEALNKKTALICPACECRLENNNYQSRSYCQDTSDRMGPKQICFCPSCGLGIATPALSHEEMESFYKDGDYWKKSDATVFRPQTNPGHYACAQSRWSFVKSLLLSQQEPKELSILDVGAGYGYFGAVAASDKDYTLKSYSVVEPDRIFQESLEKTWSESFKEVEFELKDSLEEIQGTFDLIVFSHVLEHLSNPNDLLKMAKEKLKKDGHLFIEVPNQDHRFRKDAFPHLLFFNKLSMENLLKRNALKVQSIGCFGHVMPTSPLNEYYQNPFKMLEQLFYKARAVVPAFILVNFFLWYFGADQENDDGTWIRAIAANNS